MFIPYIVIFSNTFDQDVKNIITRLTMYDMTINKFGARKIILLGREFGNGHIAIDRRKLINIEKWRLPKNGIEVEKALGFFNYFRNFIPKYSQVASPL